MAGDLVVPKRANSARLHGDSVLPLPPLLPGVDRALSVFEDTMPSDLRYFPFFPSDFLSDRKVILMTNEQVGCYIKLLCFQWLDGSIPYAEPDKMATLLGLNREAYARLEPGLMECFPGGSNPRLSEERLKAVERHQVFSDAGKKRWPNKLKKVTRLEPGFSLTSKPGFNTRVSISIIEDYFIEIGSNREEANKFFDHFQSNGWKVGGRAPMKDWKAASRYWVRRAKEFKQTPKDSDRFTAAGGIKGEPGKYDAIMAEAQRKADEREKE